MRLKLNLRGLRRCRTEHVEIQDAESLTRIVGASSGSLACLWWRVRELQWRGSLERANPQLTSSIAIGDGVWTGTNALGGIIF